MKSGETSRFLDEGKGYLAKGDPVQASEKLYKAVEECIKTLAETYKIPEYDRVEEDGRWRSYLLVQAARRLTDELKEERIGGTWRRAFEIHVWGFHEGKLNVEHIKQDVPYVEWLVNYLESRGL